MDNRDRANDAKDGLMKELYFISGYDKKTGHEVESSPVSKDVFQRALQVLGIPPYLDCYDIDERLSQVLANEFKIELSLGKLNYQLEIAGDYTARFL